MYVFAYRHHMYICTCRCTYIRPCPLQTHPGALHLHIHETHEGSQSSSLNLVFIIVCEPCQVDASPEAQVARGGGGHDGDDPHRPDPERIKKAMQHAAAVGIRLEYEAGNFRVAPAPKLSLVWDAPTRSWVYPTDDLVDPPGIQQMPAAAPPKAAPPYMRPPGMPPMCPPPKLPAAGAAQPAPEHAAGHAGMPFPQVPAAEEADGDEEDGDEEDDGRPHSESWMRQLSKISVA